MDEAALSYGRMEGRPMVGEGSQTERETIERAGVLCCWSCCRAVAGQVRWGIRENPFQRLQDTAGKGSH